MKMSGRKCLCNFENNVDTVVESERDKITLPASVCVPVCMKESECERDYIVLEKGMTVCMRERENRVFRASVLERFRCAGVAVLVLKRRFACACLEGEIRVRVHFRNAVF